MIPLDQFREVGLGYAAEFVLEDNLPGLFDIVGSEDKDALAFQQEAVKVRDTYARLLEGLDGI